MTRTLRSLVMRLVATLPLSFGTLAGFAQDSTATPVDLLLLKGNAEIGFGQPIAVDPVLVEKLEAAGYRVTQARDFQPLTLETLQLFACVVWINPSPYASGMRYYGPSSWQGGIHMQTVERNAAVVREYVNSGGGLLIDLSVEEIGMGVVHSHRQLLEPYGIDTECAQVRDKQHAVLFDKVLKTYPRYMHWTEAVAENPITEGVNRIYYPGYTMRWDDNITTLPLYPKDAAWIPLVKAEESATVSWFRGTPYEKGHWKDAQERPQPVLVAARPFGQGRVAVTGLSHFMLYYYPYSKGIHMTGNAHWEANFGFQDGYLLEKGDGETPSDLGKLLVNLYGWLSEPALGKGFGGYAADDTGARLAEIPDVPVANVGAVWAEHDPLVRGPVRPMKILVGARSAASDGKGIPAEWAQAAKAAGIDVIAFTERYEATSDDAYRRFVEECEAHSDDEVHLLPGIDVEDALGNRFLVLGKTTPIRAHLLAEDEDAPVGRHLIWTGHLLIGLGDVLPVAARPGHLATVRENGALPHELFSHVPGIAVATYDADGNLVDNGRDAYEWQLFNASQPIPVAVHELTAPEQLAAAAKTGLQCRVNSDTPAHAAHYFRQGFGSFGGNPMRYYLSSGPVFTAAGFDSWSESPWTLRLNASGDKPITQVIIRDQAGLFRRFTPENNDVDITTHGDLGRQQWLVTEVTDAAGGTAILSPMRTLPERSFIRCGDRQNWFGALHLTLINYTGRDQSLPKTGFQPAVRLPGLQLPARLAPKLNLVHAGPGWVVTDYQIDATLVPGGRPTGADNSPMFNVLPINEFEATLRYEFMMSDDPRAVTPDAIRQQISVTTRRDLVAEGDVWPVLGKVDPAHAGDHPVGTALGNLVLLTPLRVDAQGNLGWPATPGATVPAGTEFKAAVAPIQPRDTVEILASMGFQGTPPYQLDLTQGTLLETAMAVRVQAHEHGIAGTITGGDMPVWRRGPMTRIPLRIDGLNPNWPCGVWYADADAIDEFGVLDGVGLARLQIDADRTFYVGNLLLCDNPDLRLAFAAPWTEDAIQVEAHNPTDAEITTTIRTPAAIAGRCRINQKVTVPAGQSVDVRVTAP